MKIKYEDVKALGAQSQHVVESWFKGLYYVGEQGDLLIKAFKAKPAGFIVGSLTCVAGYVTVRAVLRGIRAEIEHISVKKQVRKVEKETK